MMGKVLCTLDLQYDSNTRFVERLLITPRIMPWQPRAHDDR